MTEVSVINKAYLMPAVMAVVPGGRPRRRGRLEPLGQVVARSLRRVENAYLRYP
jgi:hypothetical protein